jgi:hypothetical protein
MTDPLAPPPTIACTTCFEEIKPTGHMIRQAQAGNFSLGICDKCGHAVRFLWPPAVRDLTKKEVEMVKGSAQTMDLIRKAQDAVVKKQHLFG